MEETKIVVGRYENELDAEIAKGHLKSSGISASIFKDDGGGMFPSLQNSDGVQLLVSESQREKALKVLQTRSH
jgi:Putative prokaryotic signal transducing protein